MPASFTFPSLAEELTGDLFLPAHGSGPWPAVVTASGFGGVKEMLLPRFGEALGEAGIACLAFDYPNFGASTGSPRQHIDPAAQRRGFADALTALQADPRIDAARLGVWGPSLAGGHALAVAAEDPRVRAAVAIVPFIALRSRPSPRLLAASAGDLVRGALRLPRKPVAIAGPPGTTAAMTADRAADWIAGVTGHSPRFRNEVTAASLLQIVRHSNRRAAGSITVPLRVILAEDDAITPAAQVRRATATSTDVDTLAFPGTHFELLDEDLDRTILHTVEWLVRHLRAGSGG